MSRMRRALAGVLERASMRIAMTRLRIKAPIPISDWAVGADDLPIILDSILGYAQNRHASVLEFGSGVSTFALISAARHFDSLNMMSIEADKTWAELVQRGVAALRERSPSSLCAEVLHAPVLNASIFVPSDISAESWHHAKYDLILIDAPPDTTRPNARLELARSIFPLLKPMGCMLVHDTKRVQERFMIESLRNHFQAVDIYGTRKGISVLRFPKQG